MNFGNELKKARKAKGLTLAKMAEKMGVSASYISDCENGRFNVGDPRKKEFADALDCELLIILKSRKKERKENGTFV